MELVLNTFGASLGREQEGFIVSTNEGKQRIPADAIDSIQISRGAQITSDAVMLAVERESALIKAGIDPYVGVLHRDDYNRPVLVYDVIELYRVWIDFIVFNLLRQDVISDEFFSVKDDGSYWLEPLGRRVLIQSINDYFEEVIDLDNGQQRSRSTNISLYAQSLAQQFKQH